AGRVRRLARPSAGFTRERPQAPETDCFTVEETPAQPAAGPAATPVADVPAMPEPSAPVPVQPEPPAPAPAPVVDPYANVAAGLTITSLDYDPTRPGARQLAAARRQRVRQRLSLPS